MARKDASARTVMRWLSVMGGRTPETHADIME